MGAIIFLFLTYDMDKTVALSTTMKKIQAVILEFEAKYNVFKIIHIEE